ncbi:hypothetical protein [Streptomyces avicenniae]|uniref:hypothetical protein n=1 Tax=Streptomyces avicenniae TaxID=500153 RepID=UPI00069B1722|nr:hypothetical protein [Streptomyces avicenniae]
MRRPFWTAAVAVLLMAGCGGPGHEAATGTGTEADVPRPLSGALHFSAAELTALRDAEEELVRACMRERGHEYRTAPARDARRAAAVNPYTLLSPRWSQSDGYGLTGEALEGPPDDPNADVLAALPDAERDAWQRALLGRQEDHVRIDLPGGRRIGYDPHSCVQVARDDVYGEGWSELRYVVEDLSNDAIRRTLASPGFAEAEADWAACMAGLGYSYTTLEDPRREIVGQLEGARGDPDRTRAVAERELALAGDDLACQLEENTHQRIADVQAAAEEPVRARAEEQLDRFRQAKRLALDRVLPSAI